MPKNADLEALLRLDAAGAAAFLRRVDRSLTAPLEQFLLRAGKGLRGQVVEAGFRLGHSGREFDARAQAACAVLAEAIEAIHAGSLIVDDIQDRTQVRRGAPAFHRAHGVDVAINAGNLLYFWGLHRIGAAGLTADAELACSRRLHRELLRAHYGQAVDVGTPIDEVPRAEVFPLYLAAIRLKSGVLMALALTLGATAAGAADERLAQLDEFGHRLGMGLQMFDDLNNIAPMASSDPNYAKRFEDLLLRRPSWVWAFAAKTCSDRDYVTFIEAVGALPEEAPFRGWLAAHDFLPRARVAASAFVDEAYDGFEQAWPAVERAAAAFDSLREVASRFSHPFVSGPA